jgi:hypothetical protein
MLACLVAPLRASSCAEASCGARPEGAARQFLVRAWGRFGAQREVKAGRLQQEGRIQKGTYNTSAAGRQQPASSRPLHRSCSLLERCTRKAADAHSRATQRAGGRVRRVAPYRGAHRAKQLSAGLLRLRAPRRCARRRRRPDTPRLTLRTRCTQLLQRAKQLRARGCHHGALAQHSRTRMLVRRRVAAWLRAPPVRLGGPFPQQLRGACCARGAL